MKQINSKSLMILFALVAAFSFSSCERVPYNYVGVLMENYGKDGKIDCKVVKGKVQTWPMGTTLHLAPVFEQRGKFENQIILKAADNTQFKAQPHYSYQVIEERAVDVIFDNKHIGGGDDFMRSLEDNILEPRVFDLIREESRKYATDVLMATGGSLKFEKTLETLVSAEFENRGLRLITFSAQIEFDDKVTDKISDRNEIDTNLSVLDKQIQQQIKKNELAALEAQENKIRSSGITPQLLQEKFIEKWDGKSTLYSNPVPVMQVNR